MKLCHFTGLEYLRSILAEGRAGRNPMQATATWRRVTAVEPAPKQWNVGAVVHLEPIDCSRLERDFDVETATLRETGGRDERR